MQMRPFSNSNSELQHITPTLSLRRLYNASTMLRFSCFFVSRRAFVSEGAAKATGFRRDDSLGGDATASSPEANCLAQNRYSDFPRTQFSCSPRSGHSRESSEDGVIGSSRSLKPSRTEDKLNLLCSLSLLTPSLPTPPLLTPPLCL